MDYGTKLSEIASTLSAPAVLAWRAIRQQDVVDRLQLQLDGIEQRVFKLQNDMDTVSKDKTTILGEMNDLKAERDAAQDALEAEKLVLAEMQTKLNAVAGKVGYRPGFMHPEGQGRFYKFGFLSPDDSMFYPFADPRDSYKPTKAMISWAKDKQGLSKYEKLMAIWKYGKPGTPYAADKSDNTQLPLETESRKKGDCEDTSKRQTALAMLLGLDDNEYFDVVGPSGFGYHCYNIVWISDENFLEAGIRGKPSAWYICESTLQSIPVTATPMPLVGSQYWIDNGAFNWNHYGAIKASELPAFNGAAPGGFVASILRTRKIDHSREKHDSIEQHWREYFGP